MAAPLAQRRWCEYQRLEKALWSVSRGPEYERCEEKTSSPPYIFAINHRSCLHTPDSFHSVARDCLTPLALASLVWSAAGPLGAALSATFSRGAITHRGRSAARLCDIVK